MTSYFDRMTAARKVAAAMTEVESAKHAVGTGSDRYRQAKKDLDQALTNAALAGTFDHEIDAARGRRK